MGTDNIVKVYSTQDKDSIRYQTPGSSGFDIPSNEEVLIAPGEIKLVSTGLFFCLPDNHELQVRPRSGLACKHGITVLNTPGTIDSDYTGEIKVILINLGTESFTIKVGDRIAQGVIVSGIKQFQFEFVNDLEEINKDNSERGSNGFGSTGIGRK